MPKRFYSYDLQKKYPKFDMKFKYQIHKELKFQGFNPGLSKRLLSFLAYDGDLWPWALSRWNTQYKRYNSCMFACR